MSFTTEHNNKTWYLYKMDMNFNDGRVYSRYFFSVRDKPKNDKWIPLDRVPEGREVKHLWIPIIKKVSEVNGEQQF